jgi:predicted outer membrane repeat protein
LTLNDCVVSGNRSDANGRGAGIYNAYAAALTVNRCVFANNVAAEGEGGGIYVFGEATINDSTFRENRGAGTYSRGGGLHVDYFGTGHVARCTFSGNSVAGVNAQGGGIYNYGALDIVNQCSVATVPVALAAACTWTRYRAARRSAIARSRAIRPQKAQAYTTTVSSPTTPGESQFPTQSSRGIRPQPRTLTTGASSIPAGTFMIAGRSTAPARARIGLGSGRVEAAPPQRPNADAPFWRQPGD